MVVKRSLRKTLFIGFLVSILLCASVLPSLAYSNELFDTNLDFPYRMYYDNDNRPFIALFNADSPSNVNFGDLSPIGADMLVNGDTHTYFKLPYGCVLAGIIIYNTYSQTRGFYYSDSWWYFFNSYINVNQNLILAFNAASSDVYPKISLTNLKSFELDACKYSYTKECYFCFSERSIEFLYHYSYYLLYQSGMIDISYDEFRVNVFSISSSIDLVYDISRNAYTYKDSLYNIQTTAYSTASYIPINNCFEEYLIPNGYDPISTIFSLIKEGGIFNWLPQAFRIIISAQIGIIISIVSFLYFKKVLARVS